MHDLLGQTLEEEETTDDKLTTLAESLINLEADRGPDLEEELISSRRREHSRRV